MAKKKEVCPECGGSKRGRGYAHNSGCSQASSKPATGRRRKADVLELLETELPTATLVRAEALIQQQLAERDKSEVKKVRQAMENVTALRQQLEEAEALIA